MILIPQIIKTIVVKNIQGLETNKEFNIRQFSNKPVVDKDGDQPSYFKDFLFIKQM